MGADYYESSFKLWNVLLQKVPLFYAGGRRMIDQTRHAKICRSCLSITWVKGPYTLGNWANRKFWECGCNQ